LNKLLNIEWNKILKGALIASAGCGLTYLSEWASNADFGEMAPIVTALFAVAVNIFRKIGSAK